MSWYDPPCRIGRSSSLHRLRVQVEQPAGWIVTLLDVAIRRAAVELPELVFAVVRIGVERLVSAVVTHRPFDAPVDVAVRGAIDDGYGRPEADVDVGEAGAQRVQRPARR